MSREVKRIDKSFKWFENRKNRRGKAEIWAGYLICCANPECVGCKLCETVIEPLSGDGWQMWETTTEGSPISPVCDTPEELAAWLADNKASAFGSETAHYQSWLKMIKGSGSAPSMVYTPEKGLQNGVDASE